MDDDVKPERKENGTDNVETEGVPALANAEEDGCAEGDENPGEQRTDGDRRKSAEGEWVFAHDFISFLSCRHILP